MQNYFRRGDILVAPKDLDLTIRVVATNQCKVDYKSIFQDYRNTRTVEEVKDGLIRFVGDFELWFSESYFENFRAIRKGVSYEVYY